MNEQTIELPQLSLAHYFDLLKRRRWQVIPISLLGLFIGGIVAFFVPRYYVAETYVDYYRLPSDVEARPAEDPFKFVVDNATILIRRPLEPLRRSWVGRRAPSPIPPTVVKQSARSSRASACTT